MKSSASQDRVRNVFSNFQKFSPIGTNLEFLAEYDKCHEQGSPFVVWVLSTSIKTLYKLQVVSPFIYDGNLMAGDFESFTFALLTSRSDMHIEAIKAAYLIPAITAHKRRSISMTEIFPRMVPTYRVPDYEIERFAHSMNKKYPVSNINHRIKVSDTVRMIGSPEWIEQELRRRERWMTT